MPSIISKSITSQISNHAPIGLFLAFCALNTGCTQQITPSGSAKTPVSQSQPLTQAELRTNILKETQPSGKLDFFTSIKGHEYDGAQIKPGVYATALEFALYKWGRSVNELGISSVEEAYNIFSEFKGKPASARDKATIELGFNKKLEE